MKSVISRMLENYKRLTRRKQVALVHDDDLVNLLLELEILDDLEAGRLTCTSCGTTISLDNLAGWRKKASGWLLFCDDNDCVLELSSLVPGNVGLTDGSN